MVFISHYRMVQFDHSSMCSGSFTCTSLKCLECQRTWESCLECQCIGMWVEWDEKEVWCVTSSQNAVAAVWILFPRIIKVPLTIFAHFTFGLQTKGEILYRIIEGIFAPSTTFAHPLPLFAHLPPLFAQPLPLFAHPLPLFAHPLPLYVHFTLSTYTIQAQPLMKLRIPSQTYPAEKSYPWETSND